MDRNSPNPSVQSKGNKKSSNNVKEHKMDTKYKNKNKNKNKNVANNHAQSNGHFLDFIQKYAPSKLSAMVVKAAPYVKKGVITYRALSHALPYMMDIIETLFPLVAGTSDIKPSSLSLEQKVLHIKNDPNTNIQLIQARQMLMEALSGGNVTQLTIPVECILSQNTIYLTSGSLTLSGTTNTAVIIAVSFSNSAQANGAGTFVALFDEYKWKPKIKFEYFPTYEQYSSGNLFMAVGAIDNDNGTAGVGTTQLWAYDSAILFPLAPASTPSACTQTWHGELHGQPNLAWYPCTVTGVNVQVMWLRLGYFGNDTTTSIPKIGMVSWTGEVVLRQMTA